MLITCSTLLSWFHEGTPKYVEDRGAYTAPCEFQERQRLQLRISVPATPKVLYEPVYISNPCEERNLLNFVLPP